MGTFHYIIKPAIYMRIEPRLGAEVVSQAIFSEEVQVLDQIGQWTRVQTVVDQYSGWIETNGMATRSSQYGGAGSVRVNRLSAHIYEIKDVLYGPLMTLPYESILEVTGELMEGRWQKVVLPDYREAFIQAGDFSPIPKPMTRSSMVQLSQQFIGLPYSWGGRSSFGYDCTGFTQMLYRQMGIFLPRDSKDQIHWEGFNTVQENEIQAGDLIFFGIDASTIQHVGVYLQDDYFIHATLAEQAPYIRLSKLSQPNWRGEGKFKFRTVRQVRR